MSWRRDDPIGLNGCLTRKQILLMNLLKRGWPAWKCAEAMGISESAVSGLRRRAAERAARIIQEMEADYPAGDTVDPSPSVSDP